MGQAKIISGGTDGYYRVELIKDIADTTARLAEVNESLSMIAGKIAQAQSDYLTAVAALENALDVLDDAISAMTDDVSDVLQATETANTARADAGAKLRTWNSLKMEQVSLDKEKTRLEAMVAPEQMDVYCADLTEDLSTGTTVGTLEINGNGSDVHIRPGGSASGALGKIKPAGDGSAAGAVFNLALFPWWQKFLPTYRAGVITATTATKASENSPFEVTVNVTLDAALSSQQGIDINQAATLQNVPAVYMN